MKFKKRGLLLVAISLVLGVGAALVAKNMVQDQATVAEDTNTKQIATAAIAIPYGTKIEARHVKMVALPDEAVPVGGIGTLEELFEVTSESAVLVSIHFLPG